MPEAKLRIEALGVGLGFDADGAGSQPGFRRLQTPVQQLGPQALAPGSGDHPAQGGLWEGGARRQDAQVGLDALLVPRKQVQGGSVFAVQLWIGAALLHHKHVHPQPQNFIELFQSELSKGFCVPFHTVSSCRVYIEWPYSSIQVGQMQKLPGHGSAF